MNQKDESAAAEGAGSRNADPRGPLHRVRGPGPRLQGDRRGGNRDADTRDNTVEAITLDAAGAARAALLALRKLVSGLRTALLALAALIWLAVTAVACLAGVGLLMAPSALHALHAVAERERRRLAR